MFFCFFLIVALNISNLLVPCASAEKKGTITRKYNLPAKITNIRVQAHYAHVRLLKFQSKKKKRALETHYNEFLDMREESETLVISEKDFPNEKITWNFSGKAPIMTIKVPKSLSIEIAVFAGKVEINKFWKTNLSVFMPGRGFINVNNTSGNLNVFQGEGNIKINSHKGDITVQAENSHITLESCTGKKMNLNSFKGQIDISKSKGHLSVRSFRSPLVLNHFTGQLNFQQEKGGIYFKPMIGSVFGYSKEGDVRGLMYPNEVNIETNLGRIYLNMPHSKAWVTAETWEGKLFTPVYFNRIKTGGVDRAKGQMRGGKRKGNVSLKSRSGSIKIY